MQQVGQTSAPDAHRQTTSSYETMKPWARTLARPDPKVSGLSEEQRISPAASGYSPFRILGSRRWTLDRGSSLGKCSSAGVSPEVRTSIGLQRVLGIFFLLSCGLVEGLAFIHVGSIGWTLRSLGFRTSGQNDGITPVPKSIPCSETTTLIF